MNKEEEIEDSLRFVKEMQLYYKSGFFENPRNVFDWERYVPLAREEVDKKYQEENIYRNKRIEDAVQYSNQMVERDRENPYYMSRIGTAAMNPAGYMGCPGRRRLEEYEEEDEEEEEEERGFFQTVAIRFVEIVICVVLAFSISAGFNKYVGTHTMVEGSSMESTLHNQDYLFVNKVTYLIDNPKRFDIIVFSYSPDTYYIKRVIGLPGESIRIADGKIYINGEELQEDYGLEVMEDSGLAAEEITIGADEYFVLGDNRNHSTDSRSETVGNVKIKDIVGKAFFRFYPVDNIGFVE